MKALHCGVFSVLLAIVGVIQAQPVKRLAGDRERLIGAWRLVHIESPGTDGKTSPGPEPTGMLLYTPDGHVSVQLMYPDSAGALSNDYVRNGYEASFGSYEIDETNHLLTHHIEGSNTRGLLVGKDLPRVYRFDAGGRLIIKSERPDEHWFVVWEHY
jgi:hypothetical protein